MIKRINISLSSILGNYKILAQHPKFVLGTFARAMLGIPCVVWITLSREMLVSRAHMSMVMYGVWQIPVFGARFGDLFCMCVRQFIDPQTSEKLGSG